MRSSWPIALGIALCGCSSHALDATVPANFAGGSAATGAARQLAKPPKSSPAYGIIYNFDSVGGVTDGQVPLGRLIALNGLLYSTTNGGSTLQKPGCESGCGTVFSLNPSTGAESVLYSFNGNMGSNDGILPQDGVTNVNGTLWGTTAYSASGVQGFGAIFTLNPSGGESIVHTFAGQPNDGGYPLGDLVYDGVGTLYGTTNTGGSHNYGSIFSVTTSGQYQMIHSFAGAGNNDGANPNAGLTIDKKGNLYGTTSGGGSGYCGTVFKITPAGKEHVIYNFQGRPDGCSPDSDLTYDGKGHFYGSTYTGGANGNYGTVYEISRSGKERVIYQFQAGTDGANPYGAVAYDGHGHVYGTTQYGGNQGFQNNSGTIFEIKVSTGKETQLHVFSGNEQVNDYDGDTPVGAVLLDGQGHLYGTTRAGGQYGNGTVWEVGGL